MSLRVRAGSFVNTKGEVGKNKPADMVKENGVKMMKNLICGLGSYKTDNAIVTISKAAPVIDSVVKNFDTVVQMKAMQTTHKKREMIGDVNVIINNIKDIHLWQVQPGRTLHGFRQISDCPFSFPCHLLKMNVAHRLRRGLPRIDLSYHSDEESD